MECQTELRRTGPFERSRLFRNTVPTQGSWWGFKILNDPPEYRESYIWVSCMSTYTWLSSLNNIVFLCFVFSPFLFPRTPLQVSGPCSKVLRRGSPQYIPYELRRSLLDTAVYTRWFLPEISETQNDSQPVTWIVHGSKVWGSSLRPQVVFGIINMCTNFVSVSENSRIPSFDLKVLGLRVYDQVPIRTFVWKDFCRYSPDDATVESRLGTLVWFQGVVDVRVLCVTRRLSPSCTLWPSFVDRLPKHGPGDGSPS